MKIQFIGATHEVTGSCTLLEVCGKKYLVDCGMEQGIDVFENVPIPVPANTIEAVFLTHAHIDHSGMLPKLYKDGFRGSIYATSTTCDLCNIMLRDSAHIQESEAEWQNRKAQRAGDELVVPVYTMADAIGAISRFRPCEYGQVIQAEEGIVVRFSDIGHLLGSACIELWLTEDGVTKKIVFSGDVGNTDQPLIKDPLPVEETDYLVLESTYGNRLHEKPGNTVGELADVLQRTFDRGGNVVIPSFAVGRTQEMLYFLRQIKEMNLIERHEGFEVYVDSPLAVEATGIFHHNIYTCFDEEAMELVKKGINPIAFPGLRLSITSEESKAINFDMKPKVILSASGMCEAGRIRHHLKHNLWRPECTVLFVGYQAVGTLGRMLVDGVDEVRLFGETIEVRASIQKLVGISGHADKNGLIKWIQGFTRKPKKVFIVHGEDSVCKSFTNCLIEEYGFDAYAPYSGTRFDIIRGEFIREMAAQPISQKPKTRHASDVFARLLAAGQRLLVVIGRNEGGANKDLAKFADQINSLCDKWDR